MRNKFLLLINLLWITQGLLAQDAQFVWAKSFGAANYDLGQSVVTDVAGNVFTFGYFMGTVDFDPGSGLANLTSSGYQDVFISKLDASGNFVWAKKMGGTSYDIGQSIALDADGNIYTTGYFRGTADYDPGPQVYNLISKGTNDVFISKLDTAGNFIWAKSIGGTASDEGYSIFPDAFGNVYVTGAFNGSVDFDPEAGSFVLSSSGLHDIFILKLDASGNFIWAKKLGGGGDNLPTSLKIDAAGDIYTTGYFNASCDFDPGPLEFNLISSGLTDIFISKLDTAGNFIWAKRIGGTTEDAGYSLGFDAAGNVFVTGSFSGTVDFDPGDGVVDLASGGSLDIFILKLDAAGNFAWAKNMGGAGGDKSFSIVLDNLGNIYTTGWFSGTADFDPGPATFNLTSGGLTDIFVSKLNAAGDFVWAKKMGGAGDDAAYAITLDPSKNILTTGKFTGTVDFDPGAPVNNLVSKGLTDVFVSKLLQIEPLTADFVASETSTFKGNPIQFTDLSTGSPDSWQWDFNNDGSVDSDEQNPVWTYNETGIYTVSLTIQAGAINSIITRQDYIQINSNVLNITNVSAAQRTNGSKILDVSYDLEGEQQEYLVSLKVSFDNGQNYEGVSQVSGNSGLVMPGQNRHIIWNAGVEFPEGFYHETMKVKVVAEENSLQCGGVITDARDGKQYQTVQIGTQCWMAQNLNIGTRINGTTNQTQNGTIEKYCYDDTESNCDEYGGLYQWNEMMNYLSTEATQGICPDGWHLPSEDEWCILTTYIDTTVDCATFGSSGTDVGGKMKETDTTHWFSPNEGATNSSGFTALPGGYGIDYDTFFNLGNIGYFWSSTLNDASTSWSRLLFSSYVTVFKLNMNKSYGHSVRCVKDESSTSQLIVVPESQTVSHSAGTALFDVSSNVTWFVSENENWLEVTPTIGNNNGTFTVSYAENLSPEPRTGSIIVISSDGVLQQTVTIIQSGSPAGSCGDPITDIRDGKTYSTIQIGTQCWMAQNLNIGTRINILTGQSQNDIIEKYCYNNNESECNTYGGLYQWDEVMNYSTTPGVQGICMTGWHIPTYEEALELQDFLGGQSIAGGAMKEAGILHWSPPNLGATNSSGFTALPGGYCYTNGGSFVQSTYCYGWTSTQVSYTNPRFWWLSYELEEMGWDAQAAKFGFSVRCLKNN